MAKSGIPFQDYDSVLNMAQHFFIEQNSMVLLPSNQNSINLNETLASNEIELASVIFPLLSEYTTITSRLRAFETHVIGMGLLAANQQKRANISGTSDNPGEVALSNRQYDVMDAFYSTNAISPESRMTTDEIATRLNVDSAALKEPVSRLSSRKLIETKKGRGGGLWLSVIGRNLVETQRKR